nr:uncharacterized protein LOC123745478 [Procambarus clarkii]
MPIVKKVPDWMENAGNIGSRRREGKKYAVEDEALDRIAKEVNYLLNLHHEMDNFEALYLELHSHMVTRISPGHDASQTTSIKRITGLDASRRRMLQGMEGEYRQENGHTYPTSSDLCYEEEDNVHVYTRDEKKSDCILRKRSESMTKLIQYPAQEVCEKMPQEMWIYLTNVSLIFNRMRYLLSS